MKSECGNLESSSVQFSKMAGQLRKFHHVAKQQNSKSGTQGRQTPRKIVPTQRAFSASPL
jgi:hypothetical protein